MTLANEMSDDTVKDSMKKIHFIGIGGIGMSALADVFLSRGYTVSGSDIRLNNLTDKLQDKGADIRGDHSGDNVCRGMDLVVRSACIGEDNPEILRARDLGLTIISRSEVLEKLLKDFSESIVVTGTHGKTTTSSLVAFIADHCQLDPTILVGGEMHNLKSNSKIGESDLIVAELDESDGHFKNVSAKYSVITNLEREHMDHYGNFDNMLKAYKKFSENTISDGVFIYNGKNQWLRDITRTVKAKAINFGIDGDFDYTLKNLHCERKIEFDLVVGGADHGRISSRLIGRYNAMNILAALAVCFEAGFPPAKVIDAISKFEGIKRRFELVGEVNGIKVIEDYAHHPTEINAVLTAAREYTEGKIVTVFQPHRYSRTQDMVEEFADCFSGSDILILTDIYSADEKEKSKISVHEILSRVNREQFSRVEYFPKDRIAEFIPKCISGKDIVLVLGAGDIREIAPEILKSIEKYGRV